MNAPFKVVIPARYGSSRLPGKPLLTIAGKPMIAHVCDRALEAGADAVVVATDDERIREVVSRLGINVVMTRTDHNSGTERITEVAERQGWCASDIIVNLQGDEPLIAPASISAAAAALAGQERAGIATLAAPINKADDIFNPNAVKVVLDKNGYALYFSRAPIPWERDAFGTDGGQPSTLTGYWRHIGMYAYRVDFLKRYCRWSISPLEKVEALEQLRILWHGESIAVTTIDEIPPAGIDTAEDLQRVERLLAAKP
jgi:3-deoxy-manno-octulosonate cytidylyltransferase (CMP-KDO synthetase)